MTATPDKRDDDIEGRNIYQIFHHQIAYEIRLQQAMEKNMLCPFHYFGISDISMVDDRQIKSRKINELEILKRLLNHDIVYVDKLKQEFCEEYGYEAKLSSFENAVNVLQDEFVSNEAEYRKYRHIDIVKYDKTQTLQRL